MGAVRDILDLVYLQDMTGRLMTRHVAEHDRASCKAQLGLLHWNLAGFFQDMQGNE